MLLAVEGGGFFSSSASGYSKGLTLLLLGQKNEEKPMRVTPWNQYQLVDQESDPDLLLASGKNRLVRGCASFVCFGCAAAGLESPSPLKVGPTQQQDILPEPPVSDKGKDDTHTADLVDNNTIAKKVDLKSSLKKTATSIPVSSAVGNESEALSEKGSNVPGHTERRKVLWTDVSGGELVEVREFEASAHGSLSHQRWKSTLVARNSLVVSPEVNFQMPPNSIFFPTMGVYKSSISPEDEERSRRPCDDDGSDNEFDSGNERTCSCKIM